jgi:hypothetical protein
LRNWKYFRLLLLVKYSMLRWWDVLLRFKEVLDLKRRIIGFCAKLGSLA